MAVENIFDSRACLLLKVMGTSTESNRKFDFHLENIRTP